MRNPLLDQNFLRQLDLTRNKQTYAKIILLTWDENPIYEIQGKITAGSINIDGNSAVRRTCSLTMVAPDVDITNTYWALKNKFKLEVGVENSINPAYPDIIWFKQGIYVFTSLNMSVSSNNFTISLNGKDKMCLLNGEVGGTINAPVDFGQLEEYENNYIKLENMTKESYTSGEYYTLNNGAYTLSTSYNASDTYYKLELIRKISHIPIIEIVKNAVHSFAGEPLQNIILNDIDNYGLELLEFRGENPMFMVRNAVSGVVANMFFGTTNPPTYTAYNEEGEAYTYTLDDSFKYYNNENSMFAGGDPTVIYNKFDGDSKLYRYHIARITNGMTVGYRRTDLTYPGDLIANVGEGLTSILDKIKNMFGGFEYFYDIDGRFVFQKKQTYVNTTFDNLKISDNELYADAAKNTSAFSYSFEDGMLLSAFSDAPQILDIRNDFSIWGQRPSTTGTSPVHLRYAIDFKPTYYRPIRFNYTAEGKLDENEYANGVYYVPDNNGGYKKAVGYNEDTVYYKEVGQNLEVEPYTTETYDWRELIYQMAIDYFKYNHQKSNFSYLVAQANPDHFPSGITGYEAYYTDMQGFWRQLYNPEALDSTSSEETWVQLDITKGVSTGMFSSKTGFNENVTKNPEVLNFWIDFMNVQGDIKKYAVHSIGSRPKAVNNDKIQSIYFHETPAVLFVTEEDQMQMDNAREDYNSMTGYTFIQLQPTMEDAFSISAQGLSAKDELDNLLYEHTYAAEQVTLTSMPIYHLQPNTRIVVNDNYTGLNGEFIVSKITIPLQQGGTSSITATRAVERIY